MTHPLPRGGMIQAQWRQTMECGVQDTPQQSGSLSPSSFGPAPPAGQISCRSSHTQWKSDVRSIYDSQERNELKNKTRQVSPTGSRLFQIQLHIRLFQYAFPIECEGSKGVSLVWNTETPDLKNCSYFWYNDTILKHFTDKTVTKLMNIGLAVIVKARYGRCY